ncbi:MAG: efflux RND transporter periplasmic adaptor subunit [Acidiferrobacterales bacterium]
MKPFPVKIFCQIFLLISIPVLLTACSDESNKNKKTGVGHLVEVATARYESLSYVADRAGSLRAIREVKIFNQAEGRIKEVTVRQGDSVKAGQVLIRLDDTLLRAQWDKASASLRQAKRDAQRLRKLKKKQLISEETYLKSETVYEVAKAEERLLSAQLGYMTIKAPFPGKVAARKIEPGDVAPKHTHLLTIVDPSKLISDVQVSELVLPHLKLGDPASIRIDALGTESFAGKILRIYPTVDPQTRLGKIEVTLDPVPAKAQAGQFSRVTLSTGEKKRLVVPFMALRRDGAGEYLYLIDDENKVKRLAVKSGLRLTDKVEITEGLVENDKVVIKGFLGLGDGKKVKQVGPARQLPEKNSG